MLRLKAARLREGQALVLLDLDLALLRELLVDGCLLRDLRELGLDLVYLLAWVRVLWPVGDGQVLVDTLLGGLLGQLRGLVLGLGLLLDALEGLGVELGALLRL